MSSVAGRVAWLVIVLVTYAALIIPLAWREARQPAPEAPRHTRLPDFSGLDGVERKFAFFSFLMPIVQAQNDALLEQRQRLGELRERLHSGRRLGAQDLAWLERLAEDYALADLAGDPAHLLDALWKRVDIVPVPLVLVQAAKESAWGTSRFARDGNNLFGQWCYRPGCGLIPAARSAGDRHEVRAFRSVEASVASYLRNLNTHPAYQAFRERRALLRARGEPIRAEALVDTLEMYSERRGAYVEEVRGMLRSNADIIQRLRTGV